MRKLVGFIVMFWEHHQNNVRISNFYGFLAYNFKLHDCLTMQSKLP